MDENVVQQLMTITGTSKEIALNLLEACGNDIQLAIEMHLESNYDGGPCNKLSTVKSSGEGSSSSQLCSTENDSDNVRAPIPQQRAVLVDDPYHAIPYPRSRKRVSRSVFDGFRDFQAETKQQEELLLKGNTSKDSVKIKSLQDLFRPPVDITFKGTFESAKAQGQQEKRWILVNVQNVNEFVCQTLNRDVWKNEAVREIIKGHFILWQVYNDSDEGQRYMLYYPVKSYPHIAVVDPRTGERLTVWGHTGRMDSQLFCDLATAFLSEHTEFDLSSQEEVEEPIRKKQKKSGIIDASEDLQLEAAIAASLGGNGTSKSCRRKVFHVAEDEESGSELETFTDTEDEEDSGIASTRSNESTMACNNFNQACGEGTSKPLKVEPIDTEKVQVGRCANTKSEDVDVHENAGDVKKLDIERTVAETPLDSGTQLNLMLRLPNGNRETLKISESASLEDLHNRVTALGFEEGEYKLLSNFPRRDFSEMDQSLLLQSLGLYPQDTLFVQLT